MSTTRHADESGISSAQKPMRDSKDHKSCGCRKAELSFAQIDETVTPDKGCCREKRVEKSAHNKCCRSKAQ